MPPEPATLDDAPDAKQRLLTAAEEIFANKDYDSASVREICSHAGVNIAGINYHFGDKERLYIEAVKHAHSCAANHLATQEMPADLPPVEKLKLFIRGMVANMHAPASPSAMKLVMREMAHPGKAAHIVVDEFVRPMAMRLKGILRELMPHLPEPRLLMAGFSVIGQVLFYRQNRPVAELVFGKDQLAGLTLDMVTDHVTRFTLAALGLAPPLEAAS